MNFIFPVLFIVCGGWFLLFNPSAFLPTLLSAVQKAAVLSTTLLSSYALFLGLAEVMEESGVTKGASRLLSRPLKKLFKTDDEQALRLLSVNIAANMLGISGVATPCGAAAAERLSVLPHTERNHTLLFVLNATSLQLLPTTLLSLLSVEGAQNPYRIILPCLLTSFLSTFLGLSFTLLSEFFLRRRKRRKF